MPNADARALSTQDVADISTLCRLIREKLDAVSGEYTDRADVMQQTLRIEGIIHNADESAKVLAKML